MNAAEWHGACERVRALDRRLDELMTQTDAEPALAAIEAACSERRQLLTSLFPVPAGVPAEAVRRFIDTEQQASEALQARIGGARDAIGERLRGLMRGAQARRAYAGR